jgi:hypothetical protein
MAMMFLADDKPDDDKTDVWKEAQPEAPDLMAPSALADLSLDYRSPFPEKKPVLRAGGSPETGEMADPLKYEGDEGSGDAIKTPPRRTAKEMLAYMQSMNPGVSIVKEPMDSNVMGYVSSAAPNVINLNPNQTPGREELTKLHEMEHSLAFRGGDILGRPQVSAQDNAYRAYHLLKKDWTPLREFAWNMASNKDKLEKFFGVPVSSGYLNVPSDVLNQLKNRGQSLQGLAEEQMASLSALEQLTGKSLTRDPEMKKLFPSTKVMAVYDALTGPRQTRMDARDLPPHTPAPSYLYQDNPVLRFIQKNTTGKNEYGIPIKRAEGSPMGGENADHLTPQEIERMAMAQGPAFVTPSSGRGRQAGNISKALASGEAYPAVMRGVAETPYNLAGGIADIGNLALMPFGLDSKEPTLGSAHLKRLALEQGIRYPEETNPTLQGFRTVGELGASLVNPGPVATRVGQAVEKGATVVGKEAGKQILRGMEGKGPLAAVSPPVMYAIKPRGGVFVGQTERQPVMDPFHNVHPPAGMDNVFGITGTGPRPIKEVFTDDVTKYIRGQLGTHNTDLNNWLESKLGRYMRTEMATETDPFVRATDQGKKLHLHQDIDTVKEPFAAIEEVRYREGLPKSGYAKTPLGKKVEDQIDSSIYAMRMEDLIPGNLHPSMQKFIDTDPQRPAYEIAPDLSDRMQLDNLTEGMYEMLSNTKLLKYGTEGTPIPEEYLLTPEKLKGLSPVQASEKVALFNKWKEGVVQEQAANYLSKYGPVSKKYDNGRKWVSMDDLEGEPQQQELVKQAGCLGGWCTKDEDVALRYGSGDQRLSILFDEKGMPRAQLTVKNNPASVDDFINDLDDVTYSELVKTYQNPNGDLSYAMVSQSPEY